jgi:hypothetical protein
MIKKSYIYKLINSIWSEEEFPDQWKESVILAVHNNSDRTECSNYGEVSLLSSSYRIVSSTLKFKPIYTCIVEIIGIVSVDLDATDQLLIRSFAFFRYCR